MEGTIGIIDYIIELIGKIFLLFGVDLLIIAAIAGAGQIIKVLFNPSKKIIFIILFSMGVGISFLYIFVFKAVAEDNILRVSLAYPLLSIAMYMLGRKYLTKYFSTPMLTSTDEVREMKSLKEIDYEKDTNKD